uniref:EAL domain-containing protein n=2 Tax=Agrobacterium rosae TaxID=1972867 RepID=A0AAW9FJD4_9HYPH|nr:EAL domain-containing protein [Agrobacterium rosae]MDX8305236.1 EAL domain-containing protein [Agrobacterium rosae]
MLHTRKLLLIFSVPDDNPDLSLAQYRAFSKQLPLMYFILLTNTWGVSFTHLDSAPPLLTLWFPLALTVLCFYRILTWWYSINRDCTPEIAIQALKRTNRLAWVIAAAFTGWSLMLFEYGDPYMQSHVAFYMGITVIGCIFCLSHLRSAAFIVTLVVNVAFIGFFSESGNRVFVAMAVDVALVSVALLVVLCVQYRDFTNLIAKQIETQALSDENHRLANVDSLTGMPNRRFFFSQLDISFAEAQLKTTTFAVGLLDLDGFKPVNDIYGHAVGDQLLKEVGLRLNKVCDKIFVSRLGGDEFAFIVPDVETEDLFALGEEICALMRAPFLVSEAIVQISGSVGFAVYPEVGNSSMQLYERADYALYQAKREYPGGTVIFSDAHSDALCVIATIEQAFRGKSYEEHISVVFQPIMDIHSGRIVAFEALARWEKKQLGFIPPSVFIPAAERLGFIGALTKVLLRKALKEAAQWPHDVRLSFNLSAKDISSSEQALQILSIIINSGFDPKRVDLEITETAMLGDMGKARAIVETLKSTGLGISLDDFGTGYSSLTQLHQMPLDKIKIDRSFVTGIETNPASLKIVKSLISMCRDMSLESVIEGVETKEELETIRELGGTLVQGYFYSKPVSGTEALQQIQRVNGYENEDKIRAGTTPKD